jgi:hypothetical protein
MKPDEYVTLGRSGLTRVLAEEGVDQALAYVATQCPGILEKVKARTADAHKKNRSDLLPLLKSAQLETERNHPGEAEHLFAEILALEPDWSEPRKAIAQFLIQRGEVIEPAQGNAKLRQAAQVCQGTLALNPRERSPQDWATTQTNLGIALRGLGTLSRVKERRKLLAEAVAACRSALEIRTKADLPEDWAETQTNLGAALSELGSQLEGEDGLDTQRESVGLLQDVVTPRCASTMAMDPLVTLVAQSAVFAINPGPRLQAALCIAKSYCIIQIIGNMFLQTASRDVSPYRPQQAWE